MEPVVTFQLVLLLAVANGTPVLAKRLLGSHGAWPLDRGAKFADGRPLFGASKTLRGIALAIPATALAAALIGLPWETGLLTGALAMAGDLLSSFVKRRLWLAPSSRAIGLDQVPESLLPLLVARNTLGIGWADVAIGTALFVAGEIVLSRWLYRLHIRDQPY